MIQVHLPPGMVREREYIVGVLLRDFLRLDYTLLPGSRGRYRLTLDGNRYLELSDCFFPQSEHAWLKESSLPHGPLVHWRRPAALSEARLVEETVPVVFGDAAALARFQPTAAGIDLAIDIFGSAFHCLTRYEEAVLDERDAHGRFPAQASLAFREGFLGRPLVNEYAELLWACLRRLWPRLTRTRRQFAVRPTHDVDNPFRYLNRPRFRYGTYYEYPLYNL